MKAAFLGLIALLVGVIAAAAHESRPGYLGIEETAPQRYDAVWKQPAGGIADEITLTLVFPDDCADLAPRFATRDATSRITRWTMQCASGLGGRSMRIDGLEQTQMNVLVRLEDLKGQSQSLRLSPGDRTAVFAADPSARAVIGAYFALGFEHILGGVDHLLFVLTLMFLASTWRRLLGMITAFTAAHSITLTLATLGHVSLPGAPVEALIALSIVLAAAEAARPAATRASLMASAPWAVAFAFGLLHGFGFAGALADAGLPQGDVPLALLFFNLGVEAGQIAFVAAALVVLRLVDAAAPARIAAGVRLSLIYVAGGAAVYWFIDRGLGVFA